MSAVKKNGRFMVGLVGVAAVVSYLIWTGVSETMVYYLTPVAWVVVSNVNAASMSWAAESELLPMPARMSSSSNTFFEGISPRTILQNMQLASAPVFAI